MKKTTAESLILYHLIVLSGGKHFRHCLKRNLPGQAEDASNNDHDHQIHCPGRHNHLSGTYFISFAHADVGVSALHKKLQLWMTEKGDL